MRSHAAAKLCIVVAAAVALKSAHAQTTAFPTTTGGIAATTGATSASFTCPVYTHLAPLNIVDVCPISGLVFPDAEELQVSGEPTPNPAEAWLTAQVGTQKVFQPPSYAFRNGSVIHIVSGAVTYGEEGTSDDDFRFVYRQASDKFFRFVARLSYAHRELRFGGAVAGLAFRSSADANASHFSVLANIGSVICAPYAAQRSATAANTSAVPTSQNATASFVNATDGTILRLTLDNHSITAEISNDNMSSWVLVADVYSALGENFTFGFVSASNSVNTSLLPATAGWDTISIEPYCGSTGCANGTVCQRTSDAWPYFPGTNLCIELSTTTSALPVSTSSNFTAAPTGISPASTVILATSAASTGLSLAATSTVLPSTGVSSASTGSSGETLISSSSDFFSRFALWIYIVAAAFVLLCCCILVGIAVWKGRRVKRARHRRKLDLLDMDDVAGDVGRVFVESPNNLESSLNGSMVPQQVTYGRSPIVALASESQAAAPIYGKTPIPRSSSRTRSLASSTMTSTVSPSAQQSADNVYERTPARSSSKRNISQSFSLTAGHPPPALSTSSRRNCNRRLSVSRAMPPDPIYSRTPSRVESEISEVELTLTAFAPVVKPAPTSRSAGAIAESFEPGTYGRIPALRQPTDTTSGHNQPPTVTSSNLESSVALESSEGIYGRTPTHRTPRGRGTEEKQLERLGPTPTTQSEASEGIYGRTATLRIPLGRGTDDNQFERPQPVTQAQASEASEGIHGRAPTLRIPRNHASDEKQVAPPKLALKIPSEAKISSLIETTSGPATTAEDGVPYSSAPAVASASLRQEPVPVTQAKSDSIQTPLDHIPTGTNARFAATTTVDGVNYKSNAPMLRPPQNLASSHTHAPLHSNGYPPALEHSATYDSTPASSDSSSAAGVTYSSVAPVVRYHQPDGQLDTTAAGEHIYEHTPNIVRKSNGEQIEALYSRTPARALGSNPVRASSNPRQSTLIIGQPSRSLALKTDFGNNSAFDQNANLALRASSSTDRDTGVVESPVRQVSNLKNHWEQILSGASSSNVPRRPAQRSRVSYDARPSIPAPVSPSPLALDRRVDDTNVPIPMSAPVEQFEPAIPLYGYESVIDLSAEFNDTASSAGNDHLSARQEADDVTQAPTVMARSEESQIAFPKEGEIKTLLSRTDSSFLIPQTHKW